MNEFKDIGGFFGVMAIAAANPYGIRSAIWKALAAAWSGADRGQAAFRKHLGSFLYLQMVAILVLCATALGLFLAAGHGALAWGPALPKGFDAWSLVFFQKLTFGCVIALIVSAAVVFAVGLKKPLHALPVIALAGVVMIVCLWLPVIGFITHAIRTGNGWLYFVGCGVAAFAEVVTFTAGVSIGWVLEKAIVIFEKTIELSSVVGIIGPGVTMDNYREVFAPIIDVLNEKAWRSGPRNLAANLGAAVLTFLVLASYDLSVGWALVSGIAVVGVIALGVVIGLQRNLTDKVLESRKNFLWSLCKFGILPLLVLRLAAFYKPIGDKLEWVRAFFRGEVAIGQGATFWGSVVLIIAGALAVKYGWKASDGWKDGFKSKMKGPLRLAAALFLLTGAISMLIALGVIGNKNKGFTFSTPSGSGAEPVATSTSTPRPKGMPKDDVETAPSSTAPTTTQVRPQPAPRAASPSRVAIAPAHAGRLIPEIEAWGEDE